jgi:hypothetical protein
LLFLFAFNPFFLLKEKKVTMKREYPIDLSGEGLEAAGVEELMYKVFTSERDLILEQMLNGTFNAAPYKFTEKGKGLWDVPGLYIVGNKQTKRLVIGSGGNLSRRKTSYWSNMRQNPLPPNLYQEIKDELVSQETVPEDFYFIPVVVIRKGLDKKVIKNLVKKVEKKVLGEIPPEQKNLYYNRQNTVFANQTTNVSKPIRFSVYTWPSIADTCRYFTCTNPFVRKNIEKGIIDWWSPETSDLVTQEPPADGPLKTQLIAEFELATDKAGSLVIPRETVSFKGKYPFTEKNLSVFEIKDFIQQLELFSQALGNEIPSILRQLWESTTDTDTVKQDYLTLKVKAIMIQILKELDSKSLDYEKYPITGDGSGYLNEKKGWYLILNIKSKRFYVGYANDLLTRRSNHANLIRTVGERLSSEIKQDILNGSLLEDFSFVPCLVLDDSALKNETVERYLHNSEVDLIDFFKKSKDYKDRIYNTRTGSKWFKFK